MIPEVPGLVSEIVAGAGAVVDNGVGVVVAIVIVGVIAVRDLATPFCGGANI